MVISIEKGDIPLDSYTSEALVLVAANGKVGAKKYGQFNVGLLRNSSQQGGLVLNRMAYKISKFYFSGHIVALAVGRTYKECCF
jgi:hypothetical protein